jgi:hypothetical protein
MPPSDVPPPQVAGALPSTLIAEVPYTSPKGGKYRIQITNELDASDKTTHAEALAITTARASSGPPGDTFAGTDRKAAKLSISAAAEEQFDDLQKLLDSLTPDADMKAMNIDIGPDSDRVADEQRNVKASAFLYAFSRESDNDFHCILGRDPQQPPAFMNMEVSGLPDPGPSFDPLNQVRDAFKAQFPDHLLNPGYNFLKPPMPVAIGGSLFFDATHARGGQTPGPAKAKPKSIWEVHPVTTLTFEP